MEIVTDPDIRSAEQARRYAEELQLLLRAIGVSDADMEHGQMRVEANVSLRRRGTEPFGTRVEVKNMNSFRSVERAIAFEIERQAAALEAGETLTQDTRGWDDARGVDLRDAVEGGLPRLPLLPGAGPAAAPGRPGLAGGDPGGAARAAGRAPRALRATTLGLSAYDAAVIVADPAMSAAFEAIRAPDPDLPPKEVANLVSGDYARAAKATAERAPTGWSVGRPGPSWPISSGGSSPATSAGRTPARSSTSTSPPVRPVGAIVDERGFRQISDTAELDRPIVDEVIADNPKAVADYRAGKPTIGFLVGQVMKATGGQANAGARRRRGPATARPRPGGGRRRPADGRRQRRPASSAARSSW